MKILELFAGSRSIGRTAEALGYTVFSVDWEKYEGVDLAKDIEDLQPEDIPFIPDGIWLSPDCTTYTVTAIYRHRNGVLPKTEYAAKCDRVNQNALRIVKHFLALNPLLVYWIENPRGMLRKMPWMQEFTRYTVWYCQYGDSRAKPTDIWTNSPVWVPRPPCFNGNRACHHQPAPRGSRTGTQGLKGSYDRSRIPQQLCTELLETF